MRITESVFRKKDQERKACSYCSEEKAFLMTKPKEFSVNGVTSVNFNHTETDLWTCLECFSIELDTIDYPVDIHEYKE